MFPSEKLFHLGPLRPEKHEKKKHKERKKELQMRLREMKRKNSSLDIKKIMQTFFCSQNAT
jgi:hypothetical protein